MRHTDVVDTGRRILQHIKDKTLDLGAEPLTVDTKCFTDPDRFEREKEILFRRTPQVFGWAGEVAEPGDYVARDIAGIPVLVTRDQDGGLNAFVNACTHRGSQVADENAAGESLDRGCGNAKRFTCGYHGWTFSNSGALTGIPARKQFPGIDPDQFGLKRLPVTVSAGLVVVGLRPDVEVEGFLDALEEPFAGFPYAETRTAITETFRLKCNWKIAQDVNVEAYHVPFLHKETISQIVSNNGIVDVFGGLHTRFAVPIIGFDQLANVPEENWPDRLPMVNVQTVFPSTVLIESPVSTSMLRIYPGDRPNETVLHMSGGMWGPVDYDNALTNHKNNSGVLVVEDFPGAEACQRGIDAGLETMVVGTGESGVAHWHKVWDEAVGERSTTPVG